MMLLINSMNIYEHNDYMQACNSTAFKYIRPLFPRQKAHTLILKTN